MTSRVLYLSENVFVIVQNCLVFSIIKPNGGSKKANFEGNFIANRNSYGQSVDRKPKCAYRRHCSDLTLNDLEPRYRWVKFSTFAIWPPACRFG